MLLSKNMGIEKARELVAGAAGELGLGAELTTQESLRILERVARQPGIVGISARFAMTHVLLKWKALDDAQDAPAPRTPPSAGAAPSPSPSPPSSSPSSSPPSSPPPARAAPSSAATAATAAAPAARAGAGERKPVLLAVDATQASLQILKIHMAAHGFEVVTCAPGEALAALSSSSPEIVMLDAHSRTADGVDGFELCRRIRKTPQGAQMVVCFLTTAPSDEDMKNAVAAGCDAFFRKPYEPADVAARLRSLLVSAAQRKRGAGARA